MSDISFSVDFAKSNHVPYVKEPTFCVVIRKKVRATAIGPNTGKMQDVGEDLGRYKYVSSISETPLDMPIEFRELHRR